MAPREREIARLYVAGRAPKEIADALEISVGTVNTRILGIVRKAKLAGRQELAAWVMQHPGCLQRGVRCEPGLHPPECRCDSPYCQAMLPLTA